MKVILATAALLLLLTGCSPFPTEAAASTDSSAAPKATEKTATLVTCDACGAQVHQDEITVVNGKNYCPMCKGHTD